MGGRLTRPIRNFNVENRAAKALERQRKAPKAAPKHASTADVLAQMQQASPDILSDVETKNEKLHEHLKNIYVDSQDPPIEIKSFRPAHQLTRQSQADSDLGVMDVAVNTELPQGRSSLKSVMGFIASHQEDPATYPAAAIAQEHKLDTAAVQNVLTHFKVMQLHIPQEMYKETKNMGKIVSEQIKTSANVASSFKLERGQGLDPPKIISDKPNTGESKT